MNELILVVDDEPKIVRLARDYLEQSSFRVLPVYDGIDALVAARQEKPDLVVLDLNLPGMDGLDVCRALRRESSVPIIMLTAHVEEADRLIGLEVGADDYIVKPFSPRELVARVRAVLRRTQGEVQTPGLLRAGVLEIDLTGHRVQRERCGDQADAHRVRLVGGVGPTSRPDFFARPTHPKAARCG